MIYFWLSLNVLAFITNLRILQHGHPGYLGPLQKMSGSFDTKYSYESHFLDLEIDKVR